jgi:hypothetical protein
LEEELPRRFEEQEATSFWLFGESENENEGRR